MDNQTYTPSSNALSSASTRLDFIGTSQHGSENVSRETLDCQVGWVVHPSGKAFPVKCGKWECRTCGPRKGRRVCARLQKSEEVKRLNRLLTLPFRISTQRNWEQAIAESGAVLNRFFVSLKRVFRGIRYFWVREVGKKSHMVHFHVLVDRYLPKSLLSRLWASAGGGSIVDITLLRHSPSYVWKYLAKFQDLPQEVWRALRGKRRYSCARSLLAPVLKCSQWVGSRFSKIAPWVLAEFPLKRVEDGVYYFYGGSYESVRACNGG